MDFTHEQITEILSNFATKPSGYSLILKFALEAIMKAERKLYQLENHESSNGFRDRKIKTHGMELAISVPRTRNGGFYSTLLCVIRSENEESNKLVSALYTKGLTTEQVSDVYEQVYGTGYSKQHISYLMNETRKEVSEWINRRLESHYLAIYIDATFVHTRRDGSVSKEAYYTVLGVKTDGKREVLSILNHPTEGARTWKMDLEMLKSRGVESVGIVISDGLKEIDTAIKEVFPNALHQLCVVHLKRNISSVFSKTQRDSIHDELNEIFKLETNDLKQLEGYNKLIEFSNKYNKKYPSLKSLLDPRNALYFTYLNLPPTIQRMAYSTNWIERLNRDFKRVLKMRGAMPSSESVLFLMGSVAIEKEDKTYKYPVSAFVGVEILENKSINQFKK